MGIVIINDWIPIHLIPFVRVGQERTTDRAVRYKNCKRQLAQEIAALRNRAALEIFPFATWHLSIIVERPRRSDVSALIDTARATWDRTGEMMASDFAGITSRLSQNGDADNYLKTVMDAANGILWWDDELVASAAATIRRDATSSRVHILAIAEIPPN